MIDNDLLKKLDKKAFEQGSVPIFPEFPQEIKRNDKSNYRLYFIFMYCLYYMHSYGIIPVDDVKNLKNIFLRDFETYSLMWNAATQSAREFIRLNSAIIACNKNKDNCECCRRIYETKTKQCENDIDVNTEIFSDESN